MSYKDIENIPTTKKEIISLGWSELDIILVSGEALIDAPTSGVALLSRLLLSYGYKVAVIDQPNIDDEASVKIFGKPKLFWGITSGMVDSMVSNYTATGKPRRSCDFTEGGVNDRRPDRAVIVYTNLIRRAFKGEEKQLIVLGGIEASLRRVTHYDSTTDKLRRPILFDSKADIILFGMAERSIIELAVAVKNGEDYKNIRGLAYLEAVKNVTLTDTDIVMPSFEECIDKKESFLEMFKLFYDNSSDVYSTRLFQQVGDRYVVLNPASIITTEILDEASELLYSHRSHPKYRGMIKAEETAKFSVNTHRGCYGDCSFCAITIHQGRRVVSRSEASILKEIKYYTTLPNFKGVVSDLGGATANQYMTSCKKMEKLGACKDKKCLYPSACKSMDISHKPLINLLIKARKIAGVKKIYAASGIRYDTVIADSEHGKEYIKQIVKDHVSGQIKLAPESFDDNVLDIMKKPANKDFEFFLKLYDELNVQLDKKQFVSCYFLVGHPGEDMSTVNHTEKMIKKYLKFKPEQVQIFTASPSTVSTAIYYTGIDMYSNKKVKVVKELGIKNKMKDILVNKR